MEPQRASLAHDAPKGEGWLHEIKLDGYRLLACRKAGQVRLYTRNAKDWTHRFEPIALDVAGLGAREAILDGEVVALDGQGVSRFQILQELLAADNPEGLLYVVFDLLYLDGVDLRDAPLDRRKDVLRRLLGPDPPPRLRFSDHVEGRGEAFFRHACRLGLEGILSKRRDQPYRSGRSLGWLKVKCQLRQEFVIGGFTEPEGTRAGFGALLLGVQRPEGLAYAGRVGTGFADEFLRRFRERLESIRRPAPPFVSGLDAADRREGRWVEPALVAEVRFSDWTRDGRLRHPVFLGVREDKPARQVVREEAVPRPASRFRLTHPERVLYPDLGLTKRDLIGFYGEIAPWILPHIAGRPLSLVRCPEGWDKPCFFQKHVSQGLPPAIRPIPVAGSEGTEVHLYVVDKEGLLSLIQMGVLEIHPWGSRVDDLEHPDRCVFDLDPHPSVPWEEVVRTARLLREHLARLGLESFAKTTGGKGLHVVVPLGGGAGWEDVTAFSRRTAEDLARLAPDRYTSRLAKASREGKIFIDYLRNHRGATAVAAYSTRAKRGAPVSVPVDWDELRPSLRSDAYGVVNLRRRLSALERDPWERMGTIRQKLPRLG